MDDKPFFSPEFFKSNREKLRKICKLSGPIIVSANGLVQKTRDDDAYPFQQLANFWYLTGINQPDMILVLDATEEYLILPQRDARFEIFSGAFDGQKLAKDSAIKTVMPNRDGWQKLSERVKKSSQIGSFKPAAEYDRTYNVYTNPASRRLVKRLKSINHNFKLVDIRPELADLRCKKSKAEVEALKYAINHTAEAYSLISKNFNKFKNETEIEAELIYYAAHHGLKQAFSPIVANGKNACTLHYQSNNSQLDHSQVTLLDIGLAANGFCADLTRVICQKPTKRQRAVYDSVLEIQNYAFGLLKPGVMPQVYEKQVAKYAGEKLRQLELIKIVDTESVFKHFRHRTSHFLGVDVHDVGDYSKPLEAGMVVTVEPGIYIDEETIGVRIEDDVLITETGIEVLSTNLSRSIDSIKIEVK